MQAVKGNLPAPPRQLPEGRILEYIVFDEHVSRSTVPLLFSNPFALTLPVEALAICRPRQRKASTELVLCFCASDWEVDSKKLWKPDDSTTEAESMDALKRHAAELFDNLGSDWMPVTPAETSRRKWWQFWR